LNNDNRLDHDNGSVTANSNDKDNENHIGNGNNTDSEIDNDSDNNMTSLSHFEQKSTLRHSNIGPVLFKVSMSTAYFARGMTLGLRYPNLLGDISNAMECVANYQYHLFTA
jgi:hypothetical protein